MQFTAEDRVRVVPGGSSVRAGAYVAPSVVCMPPMYINVGAYVDEGSMVDSHALVGSCAQVGKRVHISAAAQIGGVLEPINASPVIIEDDVLVGGNCGVYEGTQVGARAVLGAGVILTRSTPLFDLVKGTIHRSSETEPLRVPEGAVVVPGSRAITKGKAGEWGLSLVHARHREVSRRAHRSGRGTRRHPALRHSCRPTNGIIANRSFLVIAAVAAARLRCVWLTSGSAPLFLFMRWLVLLHADRVRARSSAR